MVKVVCPLSEEEVRGLFETMATVSQVSVVQTTAQARLKMPASQLHISLKASTTVITLVWTRSTNSIQVIAAATVLDKVERCVNDLVHQVDLMTKGETGQPWPEGLLRPAVDVPILSSYMGGQEDAADGERQSKLTSLAKWARRNLCQRDSQRLEEFMKASLSWRDWTGASSSSGSTNPRRSRHYTAEQQEYTTNAGLNGDEEELDMDQ